MDCRHELESKTAWLLKYKLKPLDEIPNTESILLKIKFYDDICNSADDLLQEFYKNEFSSCDRSFAGNDLFVDQVKDNIENHIKVACDASSYLKMLLKCRPKGLSIENNAKSFIESFDFIDKNEFDLICW